VHAFGQCAHADVPAAQFAAERWLKALNGVLPQTIRIVRARFVSNSFHARFSARGKIYRYRIINQPVRPPLEIGRAWHIAAPLDRNLLQRAAKLFVGRHDFTSFSANRGTKERSAIRTVDYVRIRARSSLIEIEIAADGFLYKMVRLIVGSIAGCALGKERLQLVEMRLECPSRATPRFVAPAAGLYLIRVYY